MQAMRLPNTSFAACFRGSICHARLVVLREIKFRKFGQHSDGIQNQACSKTKQPAKAGCFHILKSFRITSS
jgi:hypothetical protein